MKKNTPENKLSKLSKIDICQNELDFHYSKSKLLK